MATRVTGYTALNPNFMYFGGTNNYHIVGLRTNMPERGKLKSIKLRLGRYSSSDTPIVWGAVYDRDTGALIALSASQNITNTTTALSHLSTYTFNFNDEVVDEGRAILIGFARNTNQASRRLQFGVCTGVATAIDYMHGSYGTPVSTFSYTDYINNTALWVELTYESGGTVRVFTGSGYVPAPAKVYNGSSWIDAFVKVFNGSNWVDSQ